MAFTKNIVTDYSCPTDGTSNCRAAFLAFKADAQGLDAVLTVPAHTYYIGPRASPSNADEDYLFSGIPTFVLEGTGATFTDLGTDNDFHFGCRHGFLDSPVSDNGRIETVIAGLNTVVLQTSTDHTKFAVNDWAMVGGFHLQDGGFPINPHFFEFVKIASKQTSVLPYTITFVNPLRNSYKSTWPDWGGEFGPAALYVLDQVWDCAHDYRGFVVDKTGGPNPLGAGRKSTNSGGRSIIYRNVTPTNYDGINPSACISHSLIGCDYTAVTMEVDKCIETLSFSGCTMGTVNFQSSSVDLLTVDNSTITGTLLGTPKRTIITGSTTASVYPGAGGYGRSDEMVITDSVIGGLGLGSWVYKGGNNTVGDTIGVDNGLNTMSSGIIRIPKSYTAKSISWAVPGTYCCWQDADRLCIRLFRVNDVTDDATYVYIHTNETGTWPTVSTGLLFIQPHPCPKITVTNSSETAPAGTNDGGFIYGLNSASAGAPLYSYAKRVFNGETNPFVTSEFGSYLWGNLTSVKMNVSPAYTGSVNPAKMQPLGWFDRITLANGTMSDYIPEINIRTSGERAVSVATGSEVDTNIQTGDAAYTFAEIPMWMANYFFANMKNDIRSDSGSFAMTVTVQTNQELVPTATSPLRLRLHA